MHVGQWQFRYQARWLITVWLCARLLAPATGWAATATITALPEAVVSGPSILLSDVAQIQSDDTDLVARLQGAVMGQTPPAAVERRLSRGTILMQLVHQGFAVQTFQLQGAQHVRVSRATQRLTLPQLEDAVRQALTPRLRQVAPAMTIREIRGLQAVAVAPGPVQYQVTTPLRTLRAGSQSFTLGIQVAGNVERQLTGTAYLMVPPETAARTEALTADAQARPVAMPGNPDNRTVFTKKQWIMPRPTDQSPVIRRGDVVQIISESSSIKVSTPGEALESGRIGETIRVKNTASSREVRAQVIDKQTVRVSL